MKNFKELVQSIVGTHLQLQKSAVNAVNKALIIYGWLIGNNIVELLTMTNGII